MLVCVRDESPAGQSLHEMALESLSERITIRELLRERVHREAGPEFVIFVRNSIGTSHNVLYSWKSEIHSERGVQMGLVAQLVPPEKLAKLTERQHSVLVDAVENEVTKLLAQPDVQSEVKARLGPAVSDITDRLLK